MSKSQELREAINAAIPTSDLEWPGDDIAVAAIAAAIVSTLGITREMVGALGGFCYHKSEMGYDATLYNERIEMLNQTADILTAILDVAEGKP